MNYKLYIFLSRISELLHIFSESVHCFLRFSGFFFCVFASFNADWNPAHQIPSYDILLMPVSPRGVAHEIYCTDFCSTKWLSQSRMQGSSPARPLLEAEKGRGRSGGLLPDSQGKDDARKSPGFTTPSIPAWLCSSLARTIVGHQCLFLCFLYL